MLILRWILLPISLIYFLTVWIRNQLYDSGILKSKSFDIPTIVIGNLAIGGTGKSPMTEYLVRLLSSHYTLATLSRGYGRKTTGFQYAQLSSTAAEIGDEPLQFKNKFPKLTVAVCEDRCKGVEILKKDHQVILLDDAYQHRKLNPGFTILLFDFASLFSMMITLPTGNFRDTFSASSRANLIVITKCPRQLSLAQKQQIEYRIRRRSAAPICYSTIEYDQLRNRNHIPVEFDLSVYHILLLTGIANPQPLKEYLLDKVASIKELTFADHHNYDEADYIKINTAFQHLKGNKIIITTEKDIHRLHIDVFAALPIYYIPIQLDFITDRQIFDKKILNYLSHAQSVNKH
ncbi:tetraacyldisaccharide 4'-kinase [Sphingobacterium sp. Ka21]|uniref:Tetraacyldisaccharide 4'-kinase n=1 Tax=Sphingobacterium pedocola TaxID=2082722 RepID=A0ABR9T7Z1_9SPHI|nr:tetraacyldisaccharide 4'-kinase [Sphingobacterium pedocola]